MRAFILTTVVLIFATLTAVASERPFEQMTESYGYASEDFGGGSYLGVDTRNVTSDRLGALKLKEEKGVEVTMVDQDAPAGKAGIKDHDVIVSMNGTEVESVEQFRRLIRETPPGRVVTLGVSRDGQPVTLKVQLGDRKKAFAYSFSDSDHKPFKLAMPPVLPVPPVPPMPAFSDMDIPVSVVVVHSSARSGLMVENLTPQLGEYFGAKNGHGVLVRSVEKGSRAEKAGFRAGDIITKVNNESISDAGDFSHALRSRKENSVSVGIIREKREQTLTLSLPDRKQSSTFESFDDLPDIHAETDINLEGLNSELAQIGPQMQLAIDQAQRTMQEAAKQVCSQMQQWKQQHKKEMEKQQLELRKQQQLMRKQMDEQKDQIQQEVRKELHSLTMI